jgi:hypothetical protein
MIEIFHNYSRLHKQRHHQEGTVKLSFFDNIVQEVKLELHNKMTSIKYFLNGKNGLEDLCKLLCLPSDL